jgi:hypothetical protein
MRSLTVALCNSCQDFRVKIGLGSLLVVVAVALAIWLLSFFAK